MMSRRACAHSASSPDSSLPLPAAPNVVEFSELQPRCSSCSLRRLCVPMGLDPDGMDQLEVIIGHRRCVKKRDTLYRPGDPFTALFAVRLGTFKTLLLAEDGREQITGCVLPSEILGLDGLGDERYACQAIALEDSEVCVLPFHRLEGLARDVPALRQNLYRLLSKDIRRDQDMMMLLGSRTAEERLALFLLDLAERYQALGYSSSEFILRMTREEIASYLGLKLETVSRLFSRLQEEGLIQVQGRAIKMLDTAAFKRLVGRRD